MEKEFQNKPSVQQFYDGKVVLLTGGTGFLGKLLIHKLIRLNVKKVVLLARSKKNKTPAERMEVIYKDPLFENLTEKFPKFRQHVQVLDGDMQQEKLGLSEESETYLINNVQIVLHAAADVRFDQPLKTAINVNVRGTRDLLKLLVKLKKLEAFVYVSTAYSRCPQKNIKEDFYPIPATPTEIINLVEKMPDTEENAYDVKSLIKPWPNAYTFSKALTEDVIRQFGKLVPAAVVRPPIIISTISDPLVGWCDNVYGMNGVIVGTGAGLIRVFQADSSLIVDIMPADIVVNTILVAAHRRFHDTHTDQAYGKPKKCIPEPKIYNCVSSVDNPILWSTVFKMGKDIGDTMPPLKSLWIPIVSFTKSKFILEYRKLVYHLLPALLIDTYLWITRRKPRLVKTYKKLHTFTNGTSGASYFAMREWKFESKNTTALYNDLSDADKQMFPCTIKNLVWQDYFLTYIKGLRLYLLNEPEDNIKQAIKRRERIKILHLVVVNGWRLLLAFLFYVVLRLFGCFN